MNEQMWEHSVSLIKHCMECLYTPASYTYLLKLYLGHIAVVYHPSLVYIVLMQDIS